MEDLKNEYWYFVINSNPNLETGRGYSNKQFFKVKRQYASKAIVQQYCLNTFGNPLVHTKDGTSLPNYIISDEPYNYDDFIFSVNYIKNKPNLSPKLNCELICLNDKAEIEKKEKIN